MTVSKIFKHGPGDSIEPVTGSYIVEMSVLATSGSDQVTIFISGASDIILKTTYCVNMSLLALSGNYHDQVDVFISGAIVEV